jgi:hypothetical protein
VFYPQIVIGGKQRRIAMGAISVWAVSFDPLKIEDKKELVSVIGL